MSLGDLSNAAVTFSPCRKVEEVPRSQLTEYLSAVVTSEAEEEPLLELGPEDILLLFIMMQNSL